MGGRLRRAACRVWRTKKRPQPGGAFLFHQFARFIVRHAIGNNVHGSAARVQQRPGNRGPAVGAVVKLRRNIKPQLRGL